LSLELQYGRGAFGLVEVARFEYLEMDKACMGCVGEAMVESCDVGLERGAVEDGLVC
jgi:hypothetical protein